MNQGSVYRLILSSCGSKRDSRKAARDHSNLNRYEQATNHQNRYLGAESRIDSISRRAGFALLHGIEGGEHDRVLRPARRHDDHHHDKDHGDLPWRKTKTYLLTLTPLTWLRGHPLNRNASATIFRLKRSNRGDLFCSRQNFVASVLRRGGIAQLVRAHDS